MAEHTTQPREGGGLNIWRLVGAGLLVALTTALYFGFVITLFAGFTADIQRDTLRRELNITSPGMLERLVLQAFHEASLREDVAKLRTDIRAMDARSLENTRHGLALRKDAIAAWWDAFDSYSRLGATVANNRSAFEADFANSFLEVMNAAYQFVSSQETAMPMLDIPVGESDADKKRRADGITIMSDLHALLDDPKFINAASEGLIETVARQVDAIRSTMMAFDEKSARAQIEWANIRAEAQHAAQLRNGLQNELTDVQAEIKRQDEDFGHETLSLVALFQHPVGRILSYLIQLPTIMLTLLVTVAAGGLGAVVAFTRQNFGQVRQPITKPDDSTTEAEDPQTPDTPSPAHGWAQLGQSLNPAARLLVMTGEGIAAAMAIFLCAEAGMLMVSQGGPDGSGQIDISPFLVTFMAFVSGFMAEDAFARIQFAGQKLFRVTDRDEVS